MPKNQLSCVFCVGLRGKKTLIKVIYCAKIYPVSEEIKIIHPGLLSQNISYLDRQKDVNFRFISSDA